MKNLAIALAVGLWICQSIWTFPQQPVFVPAPSSSIAVGKGSDEVFLLDINRDGHLDMITKHSLSVTVLLGDGQGHFEPLVGTR